VVELVLPLLPLRLAHRCRRRRALETGEEEEEGS
jgi:hypothetical protein